MKDEENAMPAGRDAGLKQILVKCEGYDPVDLAPHPRNFYAPVHVCHDIDAARIIVVTNDPCANISLDGLSSQLVSGVVSESVRLDCGRNVFSGTVASADGKAKSNFSFKIFRVYPELAWEKVTNEAPWAARDSAGELVFHNRMWLLGGYIPSLTNDVWSSADGLNWTREADIPTERGIDIPIAFVFMEKIWVADIDGVLFSSADGKSWSTVTKEAPWRGRSSAGCVVFNDRIWIMGGMKDGEFLNDIWSSADGVNWKLELPQAPWSKRQIHNTPVVLDGKIWLLGGGALGNEYHPFLAWNDVWCSSDGIRWEQVLDHAPWVSRIWGSSAVYLDRMWVIGGFRSAPTWENLGDVWYSSNGADWRRLDTAPSIRHSNKHNVPLSDSVWERRHEQSVYSFAGSLWVAGGMIWPLMNDVWKITIHGLCFVSQPVIEIYSQTFYEYQAHADFNSSRKQVRYRIICGPKWLSVDGETGILRGTAPQQPGEFEICLEAYDSAGETAQQKYTLHVLQCKPIVY
jgi:hypothetical protein